LLYSVEIHLFGSLIRLLFAPHSSYIRHHSPAIMSSSSERRNARPKRKAAEAALDAIRVSNTSEEDDDMLLELDNEAAPTVFYGQIVIGTCTLPEEISLHILGFLPKTDLVHTISLVSTMWCHLSKSPLLWQSLDFPMELKASKKRLSSMARFTELLQRPQFASLKKLCFPNIHRTLNRNIFFKFSKACPLLEELDFETVYENRVGIRPYDDEMEKLPVIFPNLKKISLEMLFSTSKSLQRFTKGMGGRLVQLHVTASRGVRERERCFDETLESIGLHCPNLESFRYGFFEDWHEEQFEDTVTDNGIISLIQGCSKLKVCAQCHLRCFTPLQTFL
jgi:glutaredoxin